MKILVFYLLSALVFSLHDMDIWKKRNFPESRKLLESYRNVYNKLNAKRECRDENVFFKADRALMSNSSLLESKLIYGNNAEGSLVRYLASIRLVVRHFCSGCMITERHILTAAQCIVKIEKRQNLSEFTALVGKTQQEIERVNYHHLYKTRKAALLSYYDIGLAQIRGRVFGSNQVGWISSSNEFIEDSNEATIVGWQFSKLNFLADVPKTIDVNIVPMDICKFFFQNISFRSNKQMCGVPKKRNQQIVPEDAGSPLIKNNLVVGVVSFLVGKNGSPILLIRNSGLESYIKNAKSIMYDDNYTCQNYTMKEA